MSVLACNRKDCPHIMCDRLHDEYGYICENCFEELVESGAETDLKKFFNSPAKKKINKQASYAYFNALFPRSDR